MAKIKNMAIRVFNTMKQKKKKGDLDRENDEPHGGKNCFDEIDERATSSKQWLLKTY